MININLTLFGQMISFVIFVLICMKYIWPPVMKAIEDRQSKIADGLAAADKATQDLSDAKDKVADMLSEAKFKASEIIEQANKRKSQIIDEARVEANKEREMIVSLGHAEVMSEKSKTEDDLRKKLSSLVISGTEKIIEKSIDENLHKEILDKIKADI